jgi:hypothetical protein
VLLPLRQTALKSAEERRRAPKSAEERRRAPKSASLIFVEIEPILKKHKS